MRYIFFLLLIPTLFSCDKDTEPKAKCYECTFVNSYGGDTFKKDYCTNQIDTVRYINSLGQQYNSSCLEK